MKPASRKRSTTGKWRVWKRVEEKVQKQEVKRFCRKLPITIEDLNRFRWDSGKKRIADLSPKSKEKIWPLLSIPVKKQMRFRFSLME